VTHLRELMLEELRRRNFAETTIRTYLHGVEHFSRYFHRQPDQLGPEHIRQYQAALFTKFNFSPNTVGLRLATLRFFYIQVLKRNWSIAETPYPKKVFHLPEILSPEEVARLIDAADSPFHRILLMTLYATGARRAEAAHLKVSDIDSQRMVVHIRGGKGGKDRDVMLSPALLEALRIYWRGLRHKPTDWLFPGNRWHTASHPVTNKVLWTACQQAALRAGLEHRQIHPHTLRHCFATHRLTLHENSGSLFEQAFLVAHEIGHVVLGDDFEGEPVLEIDLPRAAEPSPVGFDRVIDYGRKQRREIQMDLFAREFLLPRSWVRALHLNDGLTASQIAAQVGAPFAVVAQQLFDALLLPSLETSATPPTQELPLNNRQELAAGHRGEAYLLEAGPGGCERL
jgi:integrase/recombinase XerD